MCCGKDHVSKLKWPVLPSRLKKNTFHCIRFLWSSHLYIMKPMHEHHIGFFLLLFVKCDLPGTITLFVAWTDLWASVFSAVHSNSCTNPDPAGVHRISVPKTEMEPWGKP